MTTLTKPMVYVIPPNELTEESFEITVDGDLVVSDDTVYVIGIRRGGVISTKLDETYHQKHARLPREYSEKYRDREDDWFSNLFVNGYVFILDVSPKDKYIANILKDRCSEFYEFQLWIGWSDLPYLYLNFFPEGTSKKSVKIPLGHQQTDTWIDEAESNFQRLKTPVCGLRVQVRAVFNVQYVQLTSVLSEEWKSPIVHMPVFTSRGGIKHNNFLFTGPLRSAASQKRRFEDFLRRKPIPDVGFSIEQSEVETQYQPNRIRTDIEQVPAFNSERRWRYWVTLFINLGLLFSEYNVPPYVMLEIVDWLPNAKMHRHIDKITKIQAIYHSVLRIKEAREEKEANKQAKN